MRKLMTVFVRIVVLAQPISCGSNRTSAETGPEAGASLGDALLGDTSLGDVLLGDVSAACRAPSPEYGPTSNFDLLPNGTPETAETCPLACGQSAWPSSGAAMIDVALPYGVCASGTADCKTLAQMPCDCGSSGGPSHAFKCSCEGGTWACRIQWMGTGLCAPCSDAGTGATDGWSAPETQVSPDVGPEPDLALSLLSAPCPGTVPSQGTVCMPSDVCFYEDCSKDGRSRATCVGGVWEIETASCGGNPCHSDSGNFDRGCVAGQICVKQSGAIVMPECDDNPCVGKASDLLTCLKGIYQGCRTDIDLEMGATVTCTNYACASGGTICQ